MLVAARLELRDICWRSKLLARCMLNSMKKMRAATMRAMKEMAIWGGKGKGKAPGAEHMCAHKRVMFTSNWYEKE